jgi:hypothetical protein
MHRKHKVPLLGVVSLGFLVIIAACIRLYRTVKEDYDPDETCKFICPY